jgi:hypothetical protein
MPLFATSNFSTAPTEFRQGLVQWLELQCFALRTEGTSLLLESRAYTKRVAIRMA